MPKDPIPKKKVNYTDALKSNLIEPNDIDKVLLLSQIANQQGIELEFDKENLSKFLSNQGLSGDKLQKALSAHEEVQKFIISNKKPLVNYYFTPQYASSKEEMEARSIQPNVKSGTSTLGFSSKKAEKEYGHSFSIKSITGENSTFYGNNTLYIDENGKFKNGNPKDDINFWGNLGRELIAMRQGIGIYKSLTRSDNKYLVLATNKEYYESLFQNNPEEKRRIEEEYGSLENFLAYNGRGLNDEYTDEFGRGIYKVAKDQDIDDSRTIEGGLTLSRLEGSLETGASKLSEAFFFVPQALDGITSLMNRGAGLFSDDYAKIAEKENQSSNKFYKQAMGTVEGNIEGNFFFDKAGDFSFRATGLNLGKLIAELALTRGAGSIMSIGGRGILSGGKILFSTAKTAATSGLAGASLRASAKNATKYILSNTAHNKWASAIVNGIYTASSFEQGYDLAMQNGYTHREAMGLGSLYGLVTHFSQKALGNPVTRQLFPANKALNKQISTVLNNIAPAYKDALSRVTTEAEEEVVTKTFFKKALSNIFGAGKKGYNFIKNSDILAEGTQEAVEYAGSQISNMALNFYDNHILNDSRQDLDDDISFNQLIENFAAGSLVSGTIGAGSAIKRQISKRNRLQAKNDFNNFADIAAYYVAHGRENELMEELSNMRENGVLGVKGIDILGNLVDGKLSTKSSNDFMYDWAINQIKVAKKNQAEALSKISANKDGNPVKFSNLKSEEKYNYVKDYFDDVFGVNQEERGKGKGLELLQNKLTEEYVKNNNLIVDNYLAYMQEDLGEGSKKKAAIIVEEQKGANGKRIVKEHGKSEFTEYDPNIHVLTDDYVFQKPTELENAELESLIKKMGISDEVYINSNGGVNIEASVLDSKVKDTRAKLEERAKSLNEDISKLEEDKKNFLSEKEDINKQLSNLKKAKKEYKELENKGLLDNQQKEELSKLQEAQKTQKTAETQETAETQAAQETAEKTQETQEAQETQEVANKERLDKGVDNKTENEASKGTSLSEKLNDLLVKEKELTEKFKQEKTIENNLRRKKQELAENRRAITALDKFYSSVQKTKRLKKGKSNLEHLSDRLKKLINVTISGSEVKDSPKEIYTISKKYLSNRRNNVISFNNSNIKRRRIIKGLDNGYNYDINFDIDSNLNDGFFGKDIGTNNTTISPKVQALLAMLQAARENEYLFSHYLDNFIKKARLKKIFEGYDVDIENIGDPVLLYIKFAQVLEINKDLLEDDAKFNNRVADKIQEFIELFDNISEDYEPSISEQIIDKRNELSDLLQEQIETEIDGKKVSKRLSDENRKSLERLNNVIAKINNAIEMFAVLEEVDFEAEAQKEEGDTNIKLISPIKTNLGGTNPNYVLNITLGISPNFDFIAALSDIYEKVVKEGKVVLSDNELSLIKFLSSSKNTFNAINALAVIIEKESKKAPNEPTNYPELKGLKPLNVQDFRNYYNETGNTNSILNLLNKIEAEISKSEDKRREIILEEAYNYILERIRNIEDFINNEDLEINDKEDAFLAFITNAFANLDIEKEIAKGDTKEEKIEFAERTYNKIENIILQGLKNLKAETKSEEEYNDAIIKIFNRVYLNKPNKEGVKTFLNIAYYSRVQFANDLREILSDEEIIPSLEQINFLYEALAYLQVPKEIKQNIPAYNIIHGEAGSGKTMLIRKILQISRNIKRRNTGNQDARLNVLYSTPAVTLGREWLESNQIEGVEITSIEAVEKENKQKTKEVVEQLNTAGNSDIIIIDEYSAFHKDILNTEGNVLFLGDKTQISFTGDNYVNINSTNEIKSPFRSGSIENFNFNRAIRNTITDISSNISLPEYLNGGTLLYTDEYGIEIINTSDADRDIKADEFAKRASSDPNGIYVGSIIKHSLSEIVSKFQGRSFDTVYFVYEENSYNMVNASALYVLATRAKKKLVILNNTNKPIVSSKISKEEMRLFPDANTKANREISENDINNFFKVYENIEAVSLPIYEGEMNKEEGVKNREEGERNMEERERNKEEGERSMEEGERSMESDIREDANVAGFTDSSLQELLQKALEKNLLLEVSSGEIIIIKDGKTIRFQSEQDAIEYIDNIVEKIPLEIETEETLSEFEERLEEVLEAEEDINIDTNSVLEKLAKKAKQGKSISEGEFINKVKQILPNAEVSIKEITDDKKSKQVEIFTEGMKIIEPIDLSNEEASFIEIIKKLERLEKQRLTQEFLNLLEKLNTETNTVFNTLYIPTSEYEGLNESDRMAKIKEVAKRANNFSISNAEEIYTIKNEETINVITGEKTNSNVVYDSNGVFIGVLNFSFVNKQNPLFGILTDLSMGKSASVKINNVSKILPLTLSKGLENRNMVEVKNDLEEMGYFVYESPIVATSGDIALIFFNDENIKKEVSKKLEDIKNFEEYKEVIEAYKNDIGFIYFQESNIFDNDILASKVAETMYNDLVGNKKEALSQEDKNKFIYGVRQFFTLGRFIRTDNNGNMGFSWNLMYFFRDIFEKYGTQKDKENTGTEYTFLNREGVQEKIAVNRGLMELLAKASYFFNEIIKIDEKIKEEKNDVEIEKLEIKKNFLLRSAIYSNPLLAAIENAYKTNKEDFVNIVKNANLQLNGVRGENVNAVKTINELGELFFTEISYPMPYLKVEVKKIEPNKEDKAKNECETGNITKVSKGKKLIK